MKKSIKFFTMATLIPASCLGGIKGADYVAEIYNAQDEIEYANETNSKIDTKDIKENNRLDNDYRDETNSLNISDELNAQSDDSAIGTPTTLEEKIEINEDNTDEVSDDTVVIEYSETFNEINTNLSSALDMLEDIYENLKNTEGEEGELAEIKTSVDEINQMIMNLKSETKEISCLINPDECCDDLEMNEFFEAIRKLEHRIDVLQSAFSNLNLGNGMTPYLTFYNNPYANVYGYNYRFYKTPQTDNEENNSNILEENKEVTNENSTEAKAKFGDINLSSNIDTYGPKDRNIDTFFNTALIDDNMYGYGAYGIPYGGNWGGPYSYGGDVNGYGYNSNNGYRNENNARTENNQNNNTNVDTINKEKSVGDIEKEPPKKVKFAKNIDTYLDENIAGNIDSMRDMKVTDYLKAKINNLFRKNKPTSEQVNDYVDKFINENKSEKNMKILLKSLPKSYEKTEIITK